MIRLIRIFTNIFLCFIVRAYHKIEKMTEKELKAQQQYLLNLKIIERKTKKPLIFGLIGLVGSGKTSVAKELAPLIGATIVEGDKIRVELRKQNEKYEGARKIAENVAIEIIKKGGNVIIDSDFIDQKKRVSLKEKAKKVGAKVIFIRTYADLDVMIGRIMDANYENVPEDFFGGASSSYQGKNKGAVVKEREMICRGLSHYNAVNIGNGRYKFELKKLPFKVFAEIDTTDEKDWQQGVKVIAKHICSLF